MAGCTYRFDEYQVDLALRELRYRGEQVQLPPKAFDCLAYLIEHCQRAVGRDELISAVWGKVSINGALLRQAVLQIRRATSHVEAGHNVIRTVPNFGYRWGVEVHAEPHAVAATPPVDSVDRERAVAIDTPTPRAASPSRSSSAPGIRFHVIKWLSALPVLLVLIGVWGHFDTGSAPADASPPTRAATCVGGGQVLDMAAVLPVDVDPGDDNLSWVRLGLMESIVARLGKNGQRVVPSEDIIALGKSVDATKLADTVRAAVCTRYLVIPRVRRSGSDWLVHLELQDIDGNHREIEVNDAGLVAAARNASDHLLVMLGHPTPAEQDDPATLKADELLARIHIALVTSDLDTAERLIDSAPETLRSSADLRWMMLDLTFHRGDFESARESLSAMRIEPGTIADPPTHAKVLSALALIDVYRAEPDAALPLLDQAIALLKSPGEIGKLGNAYNTRGLAHAMLSQYEQASADFAAARHAFVSAGRTAMLGMVDSNEGMVLLSRNRPADAVPLLTAAAERAERFNNKDSLAFTLGFLAASHLALLQPREALQAFERFGTRLGDQRDSYVGCHYAYYKARALAANGRLAEARRHLEDVLHGSVEQCQGAGLVQVPLSKLDLLEGDTEAALSNAREAVEALSNPDDARERAEAWLVLVRALRTMKSGSEIRTEIERFDAWATDQENPAAGLQFQLARAEQAWHERHFDEARSAYEEALRLARTEGVPADVSLVAGSYGQTLIAAGDLDQANRIAGQVARWSDSDFDSAVLLATIHRALGQRDQWQAHLNQARVLAGERSLPAMLAEAPGAQLASSSLVP